MKLVATLVFLFLIVTVSASTVVSLSNTGSVFVMPPSYLVTILMENKELNGTYGLIGSASAPYITSLARNYSLAENYHSIGIFGSLGNYIDLVAANNSVTCNQDPGPACIAGNMPNLVDRVETAGKTWQAYAEDYPGVQQGCYTGSGLANYTGTHFPWVYFADITGSLPRCQNLYRAESTLTQGGFPDGVFINALNASSGWANYIWLTPNECDDMHGAASCNDGCKDASLSSVPACIADGDAYLSKLVPQILSSSLFRTQNAALFIVFDEGAACSPCGPSVPIPAIWVGPHIRQPNLSNTHYDHYSYTRTVEYLWSMPSLTVNDAAATPMREFFT